MGIFSRFSDIISSNINAMLDRAEDPEKMIKMMIREMEDTLVEIKSSCAGVIAERKKLERQLEEVNSRLALWAERADLAINKGRDDLAREALIEKRRFSDLSEGLQEEIVEHGGLIDQYHRDIRELEEKLGTAKEKKRILIQRHKHASGRKRAQSEIRKMDNVETMRRFEDLERRIDSMEAEADLVNYGRKPTLDEEFENLSSDDEIERELAKLKAAKHAGAASSEA